MPGQETRFASWARPTASYRGSGRVRVVLIRKRLLV